MHFASNSELFSTYFSFFKVFTQRKSNDFAILENTIEVKSLS